MHFGCPLLLTYFPARLFLSVPAPVAHHIGEAFKRKRVGKGAVKQLLWKETMASRSGEVHQHHKTEQEARGTLRNHAMEGLLGRVRRRFV